MKRKNVLVVLPMTDEQKSDLCQAGKDCEFAFCEAASVSEEQIRDKQIIIGNLNPALIKAADQLEWLQLNSAGYEQYLTPDILRPETIMTNASGAYGPAVAEHLFAMVCAASKKLPLYRDSQNKREWSDYGQIRPLHGQTVLVVGLGDIGRYFAKMMKSLGNKVIGIRRNVGEKPDFVDEIYTLEALEHVLPQADIVALTIPVTESTRKMMGKAQFDLMKQTALFFNVGRGELVDTDALYDALLENRIWGAGIDVTDPEPLPESHPLWGLSNILITPHCSGGYHLQETLDRINGIAFRNFNHYSADEAMENLILR